MSLNINWSMLEFYLDPVPGDPDGVRECADAADLKSSAVDDLKDDVSRIRSDHDNGSVFVGKAADRFVSKLEDFPSNLSSLSDGLNAISQTLNLWANCMEDCQRKALDAYNRAVDAQNKASDANSKLYGALGGAATAGTASLQVKGPLGVDRGPLGVVDRSPLGVDFSLPAADVRRAQRNADAAKGQVDFFRKKLEEAQGSYDAACRDARMAVDNYNNGADAAVSWLNGALDDLPPVSVFDRVYYSDAWRTIVKVAEIAGYVVSFAMLFLGPGGILGLLAFALAAVGFLNDIVAFICGDENAVQLFLGFLSMVLAGAPGVLVKQSAAGLRFFAESKGLPMYQRVIGGLNSYGRNSGMVTDIDVALRQSNYKLLDNSGFANQPREKIIEFLRALPEGPKKEATRLFNDYQLEGVLPRDWKWLLEQSDLYGVFNPADAATIMRFGLDASRETLRADAMKNVAQDMVDAERRVEDHKAEHKTGFGAGLTEWAGLLAPAAPVLGLVGRVADSML
ncbi:WXG100 family type VII secretion target [Bifidobacterium asteroides]|uniref:Uncharacterized protein n=1 Tax=Bifidobacterium asteroides TaxID=1684 RepID=A0A318LZ48_9BIFI|nr:WXG100 family type VII secretion target [Bifidobacterium asteroides]PXY81269.1 hypothetical protein DKK75_07960 [Bifidobacterium asteroides]